MKLRFLIVVLMVTLMANGAFAKFFWTEGPNGVTGDWGAVDGYGDPAYWWTGETEATDHADRFPDGTEELDLFGISSVVTVNDNQTFTMWYSNRGRIYGGATVNIVPGGHLEGLGWIRVGEGSRPGTSRVNQSGGGFVLENGARTSTFGTEDKKDPAGLTLGDGGGGPDCHGIYTMSGGTMTYVNRLAKTGNGNIRIGDRLGEGTLKIVGSTATIDMGPLHMGGRTGKDQATRRATGNLEYVLDAGGASAVICEGANVHTYDPIYDVNGVLVTAGSTTRLKVELGVDEFDEVIPLTNPLDDIILVNNTTLDAVVGLFDTCNGGSAVEGAVVMLGDGVVRYLSYVGGTGNDIILTIVPEPATLALLSLGMFIIRRKK